MISQLPTPREIFTDLVANFPPHQWRERLEAACQGDEQLRRRVEALLKAHQDPDSLPMPLAQPLETVHQTDAHEPGTMIGPYKLLEQIGEGGMGLVYMAEQQRPLRRLVALKIIKPGMDSKQVIARFEAERQALAMMDHPNIAKILDAGVSSRHTPCAENADDGTRSAPATAISRPYFVMELVRGLPINQFCDENRLPLRERLTLFIQVCQAVQHAHQKGIIHRDLKPTNVLVTMHDAQPVPMIIDFGIAKALGGSLTDHTLHTGFAQMVGTPLYMSPEQADMNQLGVDTRSDVYSLGVILYELLTGTTPFDKQRLKSASFDELRRIIREEEPETVSTRLAKTKSSRQTPSAVPATDGTRNVPTTYELDWIVAKSLAKDRSERYESASNLAADIQRYLADEPVQACPPSAAYRFRKFAKKHGAVITTAALIAASLVVGTTISLWQVIRVAAAEAQATMNETKARSLAEAEAGQRKAAEANFQVALEALDRMLANVSAEELNDVPRVGPLRRKILQDAVTFCQRIAPQSATSADSRLREAQTWLRIAGLAFNVNDYRQQMVAASAAIELLSQLVAEFPDEKSYKVLLAQNYFNLGGANLALRDLAAAEKSFLRAVELYDEVTDQNSRPNIYYTTALSQLSRTLTLAGRHDEALGYLARALDLMPPSWPQHWQIKCAMAHLILKNNPEEALELNRKAIDGYRKCLEGKKTNAGKDAEFAKTLSTSAMAFGVPYAAEVEEWGREAIEIFRQDAGPSPTKQAQLSLLIQALKTQATRLRRWAEDKDAMRTDEEIRQRAAQVNDLLLESIDRERENVSRFALSKDRFILVELLHELSRLLAGDRGISAAHLPGDSAARKAQASASLAEAIQHCRGLAAEFPENAQYRAMLDGLLKNQKRIFGDQAQSKSESQPATTQSQGRRSPPPR